MADEYTIRRGDHGVEIRGVLRDADLEPVDIAGATLAFNLGPFNGGDALIEDEATNEQDDGGEDGEWSYTWAQGDTDELEPEEVYVAEVRALTSVGALQTFPNGGYIIVRVTREVGAGPVDS